jgi:PKD repeat protein
MDVDHDVDDPLYLTNFEWDLDGDGQFDDASGYHATHTFDEPGMTTIAVRATDRDGASTVRSHSVVVNASNERPAAAIGIQPEYEATSPDGDDLELIGYTLTVEGRDDRPDTAVLWDVDADGTFDDLEGPSIFLDPGVEGDQISARVEDADDAVTIATATIPTPGFGRIVHPLREERVGRPVAFRPSETDVSDTFAWDLDGDGEFDDSTAERPEHVFATAGDHLVRLRITRTGSTEHVEATRVLVRADNVPPLVSVGRYNALPDPLAGSASEVADLFPADIDGDSVVLAWDLDGDGGFDDGEGERVQHAFGVGSTLVGVRATDADGATATSAATVHAHAANEPPEVAMAISLSTDRTRGLSVFATDDGGHAPSVAWDLDGDGEFDDSTARQLTYEFPRGGDHEVAVEATDDSGARTVEVGTAQIRRVDVIATTGDVSDVTQATATLGGVVESDGQAVRYHFQYGPTEAMEAATPEFEIPAGRDATNVSAQVAGLLPGTGYHYRLVVDHHVAGGTQTAAGDTRSFTTPATASTPPTPSGEQPPSGPLLDGSVSLDDLGAVLAGNLHAAARSLRRVGIGGLVRRRGIVVRHLHALQAGSFFARLTTPARGRGRARTTVLAKGSRAVRGAGRYRLSLKLTHHGTRLLRRARRAHVTLTVAFRDDTGRVVSDQRTLRLRR